MSERRPRVSIGVPVFNGDAFLEETLNALLAQTFRDLEIIVSDNASTDKTEQICRAVAAQDSRVRYFRQDVNRGAAWNHNRLVELARGDLFKWNSADDVPAPDFVARCVSALDHDSGAVLACSNILVINEASQPILVRAVPEEVGCPEPVVRFRRHVRLDHLCTHIYGVVRLDVLRRTGLIGGYTDSDRVLLAHLALFGHFVVVPEPLYFNRHHGNRSTEVYVGWRSRTVWFDPSAANRRLYPFWTELAGFWRAIAESPLGYQRRLRCYFVMVNWLWIYKTYLVYEDLLYYPRKWIARRVPGAKALWVWLKSTAVKQA